MENASPGRANAARSDLFFRPVAWLTLHPAGERLAPQALIPRDRLAAPTAVCVSLVKAGAKPDLKEPKMLMSPRSLLMATAVLTASWVFAPAAWAGCGVNATTLKKHASWTSDARDDGMLIQVNQGQGPGSIVGMWSVTLTAGGNPFDWGYQVWHDDGTEIMNSGSRAPSTENFCMGVWEQNGPFRYKLNHFALSYDATTGALNAKVNIKENVVVDGRGSAFSGPFTADIYSPTGSLLQHIAGQIVGQRVQVN